MKIKKNILALLLCTSTFVASTCATINASTKANTTANLNIRSGPSTSYSIVTTAKKGTTIEILEKKGQWYKVKVGSKTGYASNKYIKEITSSNTTNNTSSNNSSSSTSIKMQVTATSLNVRSKASTSGKVLGKLSKGETINVISSSNGWSKINYKSTIGYVSTQYLKTISSNTNSNSNTNNNVNTSTTKMQVTATSLNIRSKASTSGKVLGKLSKNSQVDVFEIKNGWAKINYQNKAAYVSSSYLKNVVANSQTSESFVSTLNVAKQTNQIVTVVGTGGYNADVILHEKDSSGKWKQTLSTKGTVGSKGIGVVSEGSKKTPEGVYGFTFAFGNANNPGTAFEYRKVNSNHYWVDDPNSSYYNKWVDITKVKKDWNSAEHLASFKTQYKYSLAFDYNYNNPIAGKGSAFFLHVGTGNATAGCVSVSEDKMVNILNKLKPGSKIVIASNMNNIKKY